MDDRLEVPEEAPRHRVVSIVGHPEWGKAFLFDPDPEAAEEKVKTRSIKRPSAARQSNMHVRQSVIAPGADTAAHDSDSGSELDGFVYWCLPFFTSSLFVTILEDTITQLRILIECNTEMRIIKTMADMYHYKAKKYGVAKPASTDELAGIDVKKLFCVEYKLNKLEADRRNILDFCLKLYVELTVEKCFVSLLDFIQNVINREAYYLTLIENEAKNKVLLREVIRQLRQQRNQHKTVTYEVDGILANLRSQVEDAVLLTETKGRHVDNWQNARTEQHAKVIFDSEYEFTSSIEYHKRRSEHESRVHSEVESLTNILIDETLRKVEQWMDKYETDMEKIDLKIQIQRSAYQTMYEKRIHLEQKYNTHAKAIKDWIKFKEERAKAQKYHDTMMASAITVQAWWRGLLVRKKLGPYRPKKGKPPTKKK